MGQVRPGPTGAAARMGEGGRVAALGRAMLLLSAAATGHDQHRG